MNSLIIIVKRIDFFIFIITLKILFLTTIYKKKESQSLRIKLGILANSLKNGGAERQTSLLLNYLNQYKFIQITLFTTKTEEKNEYFIDLNINRIVAKGTVYYLL